MRLPGRHKRCFAVIEEAWKEEHYGTACHKLYRKQNSARNDLRKWNREVLGHCQSKVKEFTSRIESIQALERTEANAIIEAKLQVELNEWLVRNEMIWRQKSRECWLKEGDRNSKFFHLSTIIRRTRNNIDAMKNDAGPWILNTKEIGQHFVNKFKELFGEEDTDFPPDLENLIPHSLSEEDASKLCKIPTSQEIKEALWSMPTLKAPGSDGLPVLFYKE